MSLFSWCGIACKHTLAPLSVVTAVRAGLLQGSGGLFRPGAASTRAEATVVLKRLLVFGQLMM
ncbi:hypothetical protein [Paenibacillus sp. YPG26]|uniref:hypothetical protein n=1 Tax=Paenibacillus sp. YPG26 TaxID=2878915 RepID=UPI00203E2655|nr:hypothetical protein [Paenibacillus sp. YPG26]USB33582.1 hypothetical protein LDO05_01785 [Paenibacillus sp. YPG26]